MKFVFKMSFIAIGLVLMAVSVFASFISLTTSMDNIVIANDTVSKAMSITNSGDEPSWNVKVSLLLPEGFISEPLYAGKINANGVFSGRFNVSKIPGLSKGSYSIAVLTEYQDANGYQFSSISPNLIVYETPAGTRITGKLESITLGEKGTRKIQLRLMNRDNAVRSVSVRLFLPNEITTLSDQKQIEMGPNEEKSVDFEVSNFGALVGSTYSVFASFDYESDKHYSGFSVGMIEIVKEDSTLLYIAIAALLAIILVFANRNRIFKPNPGGSQ